MKGKLKNAARILLEAFGIGNLSKTSLGQIETKLLELMPLKDGYFIEAGANNGFNQSNTYYLEKICGWNGVLVEPIPELASECRKIRSRSKVFECALVDESFIDSDITILKAGLMSIVCEDRSQRDSEWAHAERGIELQPWLSSVSEIKVKARTLTQVLDDAGAPKKIDFFSLDVEGFEMNVLKGLDFDKYSINVIFCEVRPEYKNELLEFLSVKDYVVNSEVGEGGERSDLFFVKKK